VSTVRGFLGRFARLIVSWDVFRVPVAFRLIRPKKLPPVSDREHAVSGHGPRLHPTRVGADRDRYRRGDLPTSRQPSWRRLLVAVALSVATCEWVPCRRHSATQRGARQLRSASRRFARVLLWLRIEVANHDRLLQKLPVYRDVYVRARRLVSFASTEYGFPEFCEGSCAGQ
jgi:hypothetical protein